MPGMSLFEVQFNLAKGLGASMKSVANEVKQKASKSSQGTVSYVFKIAGEPRLFIVTEGQVQDVVLELLCGHASKIANITCKPIYDYTTFAKTVLGIDESETPAFDQGLTAGGPLLWFEATVTFQGPDFEELLKLWTGEAQFAIGALKHGMEMVMFKEPAARIVYGVFKVPTDAIDKAQFKSPLFSQQQQFVNMDMTCKSVELW